LCVAKGEGGGLVVRSFFFACLGGGRLFWRLFGGGISRNFRLRPQTSKKEKEGDGGKLPKFPMEEREGGKANDKEGEGVCFIPPGKKGKGGKGEKIILNGNRGEGITLIKLANF